MIIVNLNTYYTMWQITHVKYKVMDIIFSHHILDNIIIFLVSSCRRH